MREEPRPRGRINSLGVVHVLAKDRHKVTMNAETELLVSSGLFRSGEADQQQHQGQQRVPPAVVSIVRDKAENHSLADSEAHHGYCGVNNSKNLEAQPSGS